MAYEKRRLDGIVMPAPEPARLAATEKLREDARTG